MKIKFIKYILGALAFTFVLVGCSKNEDALSTVASNKQDILIFKTAEEFHTTLNKVDSMKPEERIGFEKSKGFKSFGTICDDFYATINPDKFKSETEALTFITSNSQYIQILNHSDSSKCCVTKEFRNPTRYLMNENKMYIIGNTAFKQFDEGCISTDISNIEALKASKDFIGLKSSPSFKVRSISSKAPIQKVTNAANFGSDLSDWDNKTTYATFRIEISLGTHKLYNGDTYRNTSCTIKNYKRTAGIFWFVDRICTYAIHVTTFDWYGLFSSNDCSNTNEIINSWSAPWQLLKEGTGDLSQSSPYFTYVN